MSSIGVLVISFFAFAAGAICGVIAQPNTCVCADCRKERWFLGEDDV